MVRKIFTMAETMGVKKIERTLRDQGINNPIGKCYSKKKLLELLKPYFHIEETYLHFFPARSLPFKIPAFVHRFLDKTFGFMIYATLRNKCAE